MPTSLKSLLFLFVAGSVMLTFAGRGETQQATRAEHFLDPFNSAVQKRFHDVIGFGMTRISSGRTFKPETAEEKLAISDLKRGGYQIALFLAGRNLLQDVPISYRASSPYFGSGGWHLMSGPVVVGDQKLKGLPDGPAMWEPTREAFRQFDRGGERWAFEAAGWSVEARPVRASDEKCLRCHAPVKLSFEQVNGTVLMRSAETPNELRIGDPIGSVLYVYRRED